MSKHFKLHKRCVRGSTDRESVSIPSRNLGTESRPTVQGVLKHSDPSPQSSTSPLTKGLGAQQNSTSPQHFGGLVVWWIGGLGRGDMPQKIKITKKMRV